jgi:hypothetical protein
MEQAATSSLMRSINRAAILDLTRQDGPLARSQITRRLNMSFPTVMRIVDELIEENLVRSLGTSELTGGRSRSLLAFNGSAYAAVGVDLGGTGRVGVRRWPRCTESGGYRLWEPLCSS